MKTPKPIWTPELNDLDQLNLIQDDLVSHCLIKLAEKQYTALEQIIRTFAEPAITGDITEKELNLRDITLHTCSYEKMTGTVFETWIEQRGKQIGPKLLNDITINMPEPFK